ncbi:TrlF family AAA-like ATPase [Natrinema sp. 74]|uniref:TrlF family AAA-like ATPase n=1 Tax=Natrinema sp. 74 TaxID=3384159 RepID=UPI0038D50B2C
MNPVTRGNSGAEFRKADLHVHTPGSYDYEADISPEDLVDAFIEEGLELVVAADHNRTGWFDELQDAAEERAEELQILPGVEITTPQGGDNQIHLVGIFPPQKVDEITALLHTISIDPTDPSSTQASQRIPEICSEIRERGGLAVLAHIDANSGALEETESGNIRDKIFNPDLVAAIEVVDPAIREEFPAFPAVRSSDAHHPDDLGRGFTYLKMTEPSFEGFQTALSDPESRIRFEKAEYDHPYINSIRFDGPFFDDRAVQLSPNLNSLIGGKGTGKSSVIQQVRYAFDIDPRPDRIREDYHSLIEATMAPDGEIKVQVITEAGDTYWVCRTYGEDPVVNRADGTEADIGIETFRDEFFDLEIHSQGQLLAQARNTSDQLDLIDSYFDFGEQKREREELKSELRSNAQALNSARTARDRIESDITDYDAVRENLALMEDSGVEEFLDDQDSWDDEKIHLDRLEDSLDDLADTIPTEEELPTAPTTEPEDTPNNELLAEANQIAEEAQDDVVQAISDIEDRIEAARSQLSDSIDEWSEREDDRQTEYQRLADEIEDETGVDIDEYFELKDEAAELDALENELDEKENEIQDLENRRQELLSQLRDVRRGITDTRRAGITNITESLHNIRVRLDPDGDRESFQSWFNDVLNGSNVRTTDKESITEEFDPEILFEIIRDKDTQRLIDDVGLTPTAAENVVGFDNLRNQLHELQIKELHDKPIIEIQHEGEWKALDDMSDGQKCTALLSIAMLEREKPLIVDQPEDMLDNEYIYDEVVEMASQVKENRQIIAATHNANLPILGDAEKINVMFCNGRQGFIQERGSIDDPDVRRKAKKILEGGEDAFNERTEKYGALQLN